MGVDIILQNHSKNLMKEAGSSSQNVMNGNAMNGTQSDIGPNNSQVFYVLN